MRISEETKISISIILSCILLLVGIGIFIHRQEKKEFNNGHCITCGESVIPVGYQYYTRYYCPNCKKYN